MSAKYDWYKVDTYFFPEGSKLHDNVLLGVQCRYCKFDVFQAMLNTSFSLQQMMDAISRHEKTWHADTLNA